MYIPKRYGQSREDKCPFCGEKAIAKNKQGLLVCNVHKDSILPDIKCVCGSYLEIRTGKYGPYFNCINCGNISLSKGLELKSFKLNVQRKAPVHKSEKDDFIVDPGKYKDFDYGID